MITMVKIENYKYVLERSKDSSFGCEGFFINIKIN